MQHLRLVTESSLQQFKTRQSIMDLAPEMCHIKSYYPMLGMILTISWSHIWQILNNYIDSQIPKKIKKCVILTTNVEDDFLSISLICHHVRICSAKWRWTFGSFPISITAKNIEEQCFQDGSSIMSPSYFPGVQLFFYV